jgi:hypothetical protein
MGFKRQKKPEPELPRSDADVELDSDFKDPDSETVLDSW